MFIVITREAEFYIKSKKSRRFCFRLGDLASKLNDFKTRSPCSYVILFSFFLDHFFPLKYEISVNAKYIFSVGGS
jgi:hypothetical protein